MYSIIDSPKTLPIFGRFISLHEKCRTARQKQANFHFVLQKLLVSPTKCPVNLSKENNILTRKMPTVLQILILSCKRFRSPTEVCLIREDWIHKIYIASSS